MRKKSLAYVFLAKVLDCKYRSTYSWVLPACISTELLKCANFTPLCRRQLIEPDMDRDNLVNPTKHLFRIPHAFRNCCTWPVTCWSWFCDWSSCNGRTRCDDSSCQISLFVCSRSFSPEIHVVFAIYEQNEESNTRIHAEKAILRVQELKMVCYYCDWLKWKTL